MNEDIIYDTTLNRSQIQARRVDPSDWTYLRVEKGRIGRRVTLRGHGSRE